jgi:hypothetical protein
MDASPPNRPRKPRRRWRWHVPPALVHGGESLEGVQVLEEVEGGLGLLLWETYRDVVLWAGTHPDERAELFAVGAHAARLADVRAAGVEGGLARALEAAAVVLENPAGADELEVMGACRQAADWAEQHQLLATAVTMAAAAAVAAPANAAAAFRVGQIARRPRGGRPRRDLVPPGHRAGTAGARLAELRRGLPRSGESVPGARRLPRRPPPVRPRAARRAAARAARGAGAGAARALLHRGGDRRPRPRRRSWRGRRSGRTAPATPGSRRWRTTWRTTGCPRALRAGAGGVPRRPAAPGGRGERLLCAGNLGRAAGACGDRPGFDEGGSGSGRPSGSGSASPARAGAAGAGAGGLVAARLDPRRARRRAGPRAGAAARAWARSSSRATRCWTPPAASAP